MSRNRLKSSTGVAAYKGNSFLYSKKVHRDKPRDVPEPIKTIQFDPQHKFFLGLPVASLVEWITEIVVNKEESVAAKKFFCTLLQYLQGNDLACFELASLEVEDFLTKMFVAIKDSTQSDTQLVAARLCFSVCKRNLAYGVQDMMFTGVRAKKIHVVSEWDAMVASATSKARGSSASHR